tara:strand:+ start:2552 stop:3499 length:948 start_codon:yes stop_codon:yes gene_type:complete
MGIRGLNTTIKRVAPDAINIFDISKYKNSKIAIDSSILLYKFKYASKVENSHLIGIANRIKFYLMNDILPVFIFDGTPPIEKQVTILKRKAVKEKLYLRLQELKEKKCDTEEEESIRNEEIEKITSQIIVIKKTHIDQTKELLEKSGIPYCTAPEDAEKYCAFLQKEGLVDYVVTDDTDAITFGCPVILKTSISKNITEINTDIILNKLQIDYNSFVDFCILSGCDYTEPIPQIGPITSLNLIKKYKTIENVLDFLQKDTANFNYIASRRIFKEFNYQIPNNFEKINVDKKLLMDFLNFHEFKQNVISKFIKILF